MKTEYRKLHWGKKKFWQGIPSRTVSGEERYGKSGDWYKFRGTEYLIRISNAMQESPIVANKIAKMVMDKYGLSEFDWSFIRDEDDPKQIKKYMEIMYREQQKLGKVI